MALPDGQLSSVVTAIIGAAVTIIVAVVAATAWISRKVSKVETEIDNLKDKFKKVEDDLTYMFRLDLEESHKVAERFRSELGFKGKRVKDKTMGEEDED
jgi:hypothetical protein